MEEHKPIVTEEVGRRINLVFHWRLCGLWKQLAKQEWKLMKA